MVGPDEPVLLFTVDFDERTAFEAEQKGWFGATEVRLPNGSIVPVCFSDPHRLSQDIEIANQHGTHCIAEPGLIIVPSVNREYMERAIRQLFTDGYFDRLIDLARSADASIH